MIRLLAAAAVAFELGSNIGRRVGRREGYVMRFCPNCLSGFPTPSPEYEDFMGGSS